MMSIGQTFAISMRRINKKWNKYALAMLVFLIPSIIVTALSVASQATIYIKTGCKLEEFISYFAGTMTDETMAELQIDPNLMQRTLLIILPMEIAAAAATILTIFFQLPMAAYFLSVVREHDMTLGEAMKYARKSVPLTLLIVLKLIPWFLLFVVPGVIKTIQYSQAFYIKYDHPEWSSLECIKHSCKVTNGRKGRYFLYMLMLAVINGVGENIISYVFGVVGLFGSGVWFIVAVNVLNLAASVIFSAYFNVFEQTLCSVYYEDARRSYLEDVEKDLRHTHEGSFADGAHGDPFADDGTSDSTVTDVGEATEVRKNDGGYADNDHGDPFGN